MSALLKNALLKLKETRKDSNSLVFTSPRTGKQLVDICKAIAHIAKRQELLEKFLRIN